MNQINIEVLEHLGIQAWFPKAPLPDAAPSPEWVYQFSDVRTPLLVESSNKRSVNAIEPHAERRAMAHISKTLIETKVPRPQAESLQQKSVNQPSKGEVVRYKIVFAHVGRFLLIDSLPLRSFEGFSNRHKRLLAALVLALGEPPQSVSLPITLEWPMLAGRTLDQGAIEARKFAQRQLNMLCQNQPIETLILFGDELVRWVVGEAEADSCAKLHPFPNSNLHYLVTQSLSKALNVPSAKQQIWHDIQPLI